MINPFRPGFGGRPPEFAGRGNEMRMIDGMVAPMMADRSDALSPIVFYGPRGVGKTVLLHAVERKYKGMRWTVAGRRRWIDKVRRRPEGTERGMRVIYASASKDLQTPDDVLRVVMGGHPLRNLIAKITKGHFGAEFQPDEVELSLRGYFSGSYDLDKIPPAYESTDILIRMCRDEPLLMLVDEAHKIGVESARLLFNLEQDVRRASPFFLIVSGTPGLIGHLGNADATFVKRARCLPMENLSPEAASEALVKPFSSRGFEVEADAAALMVDRSECYPFFVQEWGRVLWDNVVGRGGAVVDERAVEDASSEFRNTRRDFYVRMYEEIRGDYEFMRAVSALAAAMKRARDRGVGMDIDDGQKAICAALTDRPAGRERIDAASALMDRITASDFVWQPRGELVAGIPSFISYALDRAERFESDGRGV